MESTLQKPALVGAKTTPKDHNHRLLARHRALLPADELHRLRAAAPAPGGGRRSRTSASPPTSGSSSRWPSSSAWCCCWRRCRRGSRSGPTPASPSTSARRSSRTSRRATARRRGAGRPAPACSGRCRTSSGAACRPRQIPCATGAAMKKPRPTKSASAMIDQRIAGTRRLAREDAREGAQAHPPGRSRDRRGVEVDGDADLVPRRHRLHRARRTRASSR